MSLLASNELTPEELDAMEAAALLEQSPFPSPAPRGPAMGPIQQLDPASEYSPEELEVYQQKTELSPDDLDEQLVTSVFDDPTYIPSREEYFTARDAKARLKAEGKLPGLLEDAATGATGFIQTLGDMGHEILDDPGEFLARSPATMLATARKSWRNTNDVARWLRTSNRVDPIGRDEGSGEFIFGQIGAGRSDAETLENAQFAALEQGRKIRPVNDEDIKDYEYDFFLGERTRQKELEEWVASATAPTEFVTRMLTGRNQEEQPMKATSDIAGGLVEATNVATMGVPLAAGANTLGLSRLAKAGGSRAARVLEKAAQTGIEGMETGATRFQNLIQRTTRFTPETQTKIAKWSAAGGVGGAALGLESQIPGVAQVQDAAKVIGGAYVGYKLGLGTLRTVQKVAGPAATILRVAADPADGFDPIAQASVATKLGAFPELSPVREVLENPTKFRPIESTPARLAADPRLGPQTRAVMEGLANPLVVQGVRGASAVAGGALKGAAANAPFVGLALNAEEEKAAAAMLGIGGAFGAAGGAISRLGGVRQRRAEARASDIGRMFMDVELAGGDVAGLAKTYSPQQLGDMAAMQGIFRNKVEFVPLRGVAEKGDADYIKNAKAQLLTGAAGLFIQAPPGEKARVFIDIDAKRDGIAPHEFGHALLSSGALGGAQAAEIRANVNRRYTQAGVEVRANEYARNIIAAANEKAFPGQNLPISQDAINAKLDELGQSGLLRGDIDTLDWARDELFAEEFRTASANLDFSAIRRGMPADGSWLGSMEKVLGGHANALSISGVRIDPATGAPIDTPQSLFRDNPILAADKTLLKNLDTYIKNYRQWVNHPDQSKPRGVRVAPTARPQDLANNPQVTFHDLGNGVRGNDFAILDPATGQPMLRSQADINAETIKRQQQMRSLVGSKLLPATDPNLGPKKTADGRVTIRGRVLPQQFDFLNGFAQHIRGFGRQFEQHAARGESMQVRYHAIGSSDTGSFRTKNLGNLEAITREVIPWGWELTSKGNLMASMLDLTQFRNRALRAINQADPQMQLLFGNDMAQVEGTLKQWMDNHRQDLPGDNKIGSQKRDAINALVGIATNINRNANPFSGKIGGPGSAIKQFRLDRVDTAAGTGRVGFHFDYDKANGNLLPEVATPLPDLSRDLPPAKGQAMPDAVRLPQWQAARQPERLSERAETLKSQSRDISNQIDILSTQEREQWDINHGKSQDLGNWFLGKDLSFKILPRGRVEVAFYGGNSYFEPDIARLTLQGETVWQREGNFDFAEFQPSKKLQTLIDRAADIQANLFLAMEAEGGRADRLAAKNTVQERARRSKAAEFAALLDARDRAERSGAASFVSDVWKAFATHDENFQFGRTDSSDAGEIAKAVSTSGRPVFADDRGSTIRFSNNEGSLTIYDADTDSPYIRSTDANSQGKEDGGGKQLYCAALDWIHNNDKQIVDDTGLTAINAIRRTSNFLASALRWGTTKHLKPHAEQNLRWTTSDQLNIAEMATREMDFSLNAVPEARDWTYDFANGKFRDQSGTYLSRKRLESAVRLGDPKRTGVGMATFQRAIITRSAIQAFKRGETARSFLESARQGIGPATKILYTTAVGAIAQQATSEEE